jgi:multiple sugar transport system permease protein
MTAPSLTDTSVTAGSVTGRSPERAQRRRLADRDGFLASAFLLPAVVYVLALVGVPFVLAVAFAVSDVKTGDPSFDLVGLDNFRAALADPVFGQALRNTVVVTAVTVVLVLIGGKLLAHLLVADFRGKWVVRLCILVPWTTPATLGAISWLWLLDSIYSPLDWILRRAGLLGVPGALLGAESNVHWLGRPGTAMGAVIAVQVWRLTPLAAVIVMAGLASLPRELDEAARVDGAGFWRRLLEITEPLTLPVTAVAALFAAIFVVTDLGVVRVLTNGGPNNATQVLTSWAFLRGIDGGDVGQGAAVALFLFPLLLAAAITILRFVRGLDR